jgi:hypothetical protein
MTAQYTAHEAHWTISDMTSRKEQLMNQIRTELAFVQAQELINVSCIRRPQRQSLGTYVLNNAENK